jgi:superfamily II DNA or RNA helicase
MTEIPDIIKNKLIGYQLDHVKNMIQIIKKNNAILDASDTGTGKTYCCCALLSILKLRPIIICPKSVISVWKNVCKIFDVKPFFIVNYESIRMGKYYVNDERTYCPYIEYTEIKKQFHYLWKIDDKDICFVFDEVHRCSNYYSHNGKLLYYSKKTELPIFMLSATVSDKPEKFSIFFYMLNFIDPESVKENKLSYFEYINTMLKWIYRDPKPMVRINHMLYPERASRMRITELGDLFPKNQISSESYKLSKKRTDEIEASYQQLAFELDKLKDKEEKDKANILVKILRLHQKIEILKIPVFVELARDNLENGLSVVIFVNFTQTLKTLAEMLKTESLVYGGQTAEERDNIINDFQNNKTKIIICNIKAGSVGISLHDLHGGHQRISLISPCWSSIELIQAFGRIHRAGAKTPALQRIIYVNGSVEDKIAEKLKIKLANVNDINNGDLDLTNIDYKPPKINKL